MPDQHEKLFYDEAVVAALVNRLKNRLDGREKIRFMEVCGTHTRALWRFGFRDLLADRIELASGPGCPVCVTDESDIDWAYQAAMEGLTLHVPGDMLRVPGRHGSLSEARSRGAQVRTFYEPREALLCASREPGRNHVLFAVGFETSAPAIAVTIEQAIARSLENLFIYSALKTMPAVLELVASDPGSRVDGYILPGHVAAVTGSQAFELTEPLAKRGKPAKPAVIAGFTPVELALALDTLVASFAVGDPSLHNCYTRLVTRTGNTAAKHKVSRYFRDADSVWRGFGLVANSGLVLRDEFSRFDATRFLAKTNSCEILSECRCAQIVTGKLTPPDCPLFGNGCSPETPSGPCMVSNEGSCASYFQYRNWG